ncbi:MAG: response regulator transcription factor [Bacteroidota bacterium]|nr:response regulator transcription factor [Bacteroidota bacterium]
MKILIVDDHAIVRKGLITLLNKEFKVSEIREVDNGIDAISESRSKKWDLIIMDISMPGRNGVEALKQMRADGVKSPILMLSMQPEDQYAIRTLKAGASGFISKECPTQELTLAIHTILKGKKYISPAISEKLATSFTEMKQLAHETLSDREMQVLQLIASGKTISDISVELSLSVNTISTYRARILEKLLLHNNAELTRYALDHKLV